MSQALSVKEKKSVTPLEYARRTLLKRKRERDHHNRYNDLLMEFCNEGERLDSTLNTAWASGKF